MVSTLRVYGLVGEDRHTHRITKCVGSTAGKGAWDTREEGCRTHDFLTREATESFVEWTSTTGAKSLMGVHE